MIELKNISKSYETSAVLHDINLKFPDNETTVILGPSGSGKSTLLKSMNLLLTPEKGTLTIDNSQINFNKPYTEKSALDIRHKTSMVFQNWSLFPHLTVRENIAIAPIEVLHHSKKQAYKDANKLLEQVELEKLADFYPSQLSGGQQQRISICRALAVKPEFILLDEPTSALDPELEMQVFHLLNNLHKANQSMILVTHNIEFAKLIADNIVFIEDGKVLAASSAKDFFNSTTPRIKKFLSSITI